MLLLAIYPAGVDFPTGKKLADKEDRFPRQRLLLCLASVTGYYKDTFAWAIAPEFYKPESSILWQRLA